MTLFRESTAGELSFFYCLSFFTNEIDARLALRINLKLSQYSPVDEVHDFYNTVC